MSTSKKFSNDQGIGLETVRQLALHGAKVYMASRTQSKAEDAIKALKSEHKTIAEMEFISLDLNSIDAGIKCAEEFAQRESRLDILICNAGVMAVDYKLTEDDIEQQFQSNHLTHFVLFQKLVPQLEQAARSSGHPSRVIQLSSVAHNFITYNPFLSPDFTSKQAVNRKMGLSELGKYMRYSQSKLAALLTAREINRRYPRDLIRASAVHPGFVASNLYKNTPLAPFAPYLFISSADGA
ncbi:hypothetical protein L7F22_068395 [Adiantum nelumboides]|nr:hypothetical protein [Adiantum nelumboides]